MNTKDVRFSKDKNKDFLKTLKQRVKEYFNENKITKHANGAMVFKTVMILSIYIIPYFLVATGFFQLTFINLILWLVMGIGTAGIGMSIMHDANHGAYSKNRKVNNYLGYLLNLAGGYAGIWKIQHNVLHHSYTNVTGLDEDIAPGKVLRFSPLEKHYKAHRFQHLYAWFFYGLMTILWITTKELKQISRYNKEGLLDTRKKSFKRIYTEMIFLKITYYIVALFIPMIFSPVAWWLTIIFFIAMHFVTGFILGIVFQPAHVMPTSKYPMPNENGDMENSWAVHQLLTTTDFAPKSKILSWYVGGLNFQIEHHLFPNICHIHYKKLATIVKKTASEFNIPYNVQPTFLSAIINHAKMLKKLGQPS
ncbi:MAG: acyl-CoA desaturase [Chlorobi bacterium]|nr:acyl-CoA desaturase [Chlorobiota bacterium]